jgi:hypothetical protein
MATYLADTNLLLRPSRSCIATGTPSQRRLWRNYWAKVTKFISPRKI